MNRLDKVEALLTQCEQDVKILKDINKSLKKIEKNRKQLDDYYQSQYLKDYDASSTHAPHYRILDQDSIWNTLTDQYNEKIKLLKTLIKTI